MVCYMARQLAPYKQQETPPLWRQVHTSPEPCTFQLIADQGWARWGVARRVAQGLQHGAGPRNGHWLFGEHVFASCREVQAIRGQRNPPPSECPTGLPHIGCLHEASTVALGKGGQVPLGDCV